VSPPSTIDHPATPRRRERLAELAAVFLRLGTTAFGGPAAHIALLEDEVVARRRWVSRQRFLDLLGITNLIPGPNSTEMAIHIGYERAGWAGLLVAGTCFIVPAALITLAVAWAYVRFGSLPETAHLLYGVRPVIVAVVLQALWGLGKTAVRGRVLAGLALVTVTAGLLGVNELALLFGAGAVSASIHLARSRPGGRGGVMPAIAIGSLPLAAGSASTAFGLLPLFLFFLKVGAVLFGSGYVLVAFLHADLVGRWRWLTESQLVDAVAAGQMTPGPVFTTATFIGYVLAGLPGAALATIGIFLPAFLFVAASGPLVPLLRRHPAAGAFLDGVNVGSFALLLVVAWRLARSSLVDVTTVALAAISLLLLLRLRLSSAWLVAGGALAGLAVAYLRS